MPGRVRASTRRSSRGRSAPDRAAAAAGALDCALKLGRYMEFDALAREALQAATGTPSPEVLYLAAKGAFFRRDIRDADRIRLALEAFSMVPPPYHVAARYFEGVLKLQAGQPEEAFERFQECAGLPTVNAAQAEIREYCIARDRRGSTRTRGGSRRRSSATASCPSSRATSTRPSTRAPGRS